MTSLLLTSHVFRLPDDVVGTARYCDCRVGEPPCHRYLLTRTWDAGGRTLCVVGMNPSAANEHANDMTVHRVMLLARRRGFGALLVVNAYAYRATSPRDLRLAPDPVGLENDGSILAAARNTDLVLAAWGTIAPDRDQDVRRLLTPLAEHVVCFGRTRAGFPRHPLYQRADAGFVPFFE